MENSPKSRPSVPAQKTAINLIGSSPLNLPDLNHVKLLRDLKRSIACEAKLFGALDIYTEYQLAIRLQNYTNFDILTYSVTSTFLPPRSYIDRLIYTVGTPPRRTTKSIQAAGTHAKIWLCYKHPNAIPDVFIGSANASQMTLHELMIHLHGPDADAVVKHFNQLWTLNS